MNYYADVLKKYAVFAGRARRREYWMFALINSIIYIILAIVARVTGITILSLIYALFILIPGIAVAVRRLQDTNRSGWWILISLVPIVGVIILIVFLALDSTPGENKYGPNPKGV